MIDQQVKRELLPWEPTVAPCGTVTIPLSSGEWDLILESDGTLSLLCNVPNIRDGSVSRNAVYLGEIDTDPVDLLEGINQARTAGATKVCLT